MTEGAVLRDGVLQASKNSRLPCRREFFRFSLLKTPAAPMCHGVSRSNPHPGFS